MKDTLKIQCLCYLKVNLQTEIELDTEVDKTPTSWDL